MFRHLMLSAATIAVVFAVGCTRAEPRAVPAADTPSVVGTSGEDVEATITQLEHQWVAAIVKKDQAVLERVLADDFVGTSPTAHFYSKEGAIADLAQGAYAVEKMDLDEVTVNVYGDTAVAFASQNEKSRYDNTDVSGHYRYTNVWVKKGGRWQAVASHGTRYQTGQ